MNDKSKFPEVTIYTDGACTGNPGPGGYGAVLLFNGHRREISAAYRRTTNNRMELMAIISALKALKKKCRVNLFTDSQYIADSINKGWALRWKKNSWKRSRTEKAQNIDLWEKLLDLLEKHQVKVQWVRGHAGEAGNEKADALATAAIRTANFLVDETYEKNNSHSDRS
ncbi:MAG: ribonuclease HI [Calditrichaeota bacterium]|nr:MAG: ribonuclease HI [Calditrichota bacterium]